MKHLLLALGLLFFCQSVPAQNAFERAVLKHKIKKETRQLKKNLLVSVQLTDTTANGRPIEKSGKLDNLSADFLILKTGEKLDTIPLSRIAQIEYRSTKNKEAKVVGTVLGFGLAVIAAVVLLLVLVVVLLIGLFSFGEKTSGNSDTNKGCGWGCAGLAVGALAVVFGIGSLAAKKTYVIENPATDWEITIIA